MEALEYMKFERRYHYPGMGPRDRAIWERFIDANPNIFNVVAYNVRVGEGTPLDTVVNEESGGDINALYQRKIDVVGVSDVAVHIVELKPRASTASIGQVKGYARLFQRDFAPTLPVVPMVVTDELLPEMEYLAKDERVNLIVA